MIMYSKYIKFFDMHTHHKMTNSAKSEAIQTIKLQNLHINCTFIKQAYMY